MVEYPNLSGTDIIGLDIETRDDDLLDLGPGYHRGKPNEILCISIGTLDKRWSFPWNDATRRWLLDNRHVSVVGANILYDLGWLAVSAGVEFTGRVFDILTTESLLDGGRSWYSLDKLAKQYLEEDKQDYRLYEYCENMGWKGDPRKHLWRIWGDEPSLILDYVESDAQQALRIHTKQTEKITQEMPELMDVVQLESRLIPVLLRLRKTGVRIDMHHLETMRDQLGARIAELEQEVNRIAGMEVNTASPASCAKVFDALGLQYGTTDKGNPSITKDILELIPHPFAQTVSEVRRLRKLQSTYIEGFERFVVNGRVYTEFIPVRNGKRGTVTGRFSAQNPALQTIPARGEGKQFARRLFLPEEGMLWEKQDQSQEEYRIFAHYARGGGSEMLQHGYCSDPTFDMHTFARDFVGFPKTKEGRSLAKSLNFGAMYNMGVHKFALQIGETPPDPWSFNSFDEYKEQKAAMIAENKAARLYFAYHDRLSCIKVTSKAAQKAADTRGYARTLLNRRRYLGGQETHKALNTAVQGTGGDIMKLWLVQCEEEGVFEHVVPHLTVHDEIDFSVPPTSMGEEAAKRIQKIGQTCLKLQVPLKVDRERGPNWADVADIPLH